MLHGASTKTRVLGLRSTLRTAHGCMGGPRSFWNRVLRIRAMELFNHTKLYCQKPNSYHPPLCFPSPEIRHLELYVMMKAIGTYISLELFINPSHSSLLDVTDHTILAAHLHNFDHATITRALSSSLTSPSTRLLLNWSSPERKINGTRREGEREESGMKNTKKKIEFKNKNMRNMRKPPRLPRCGMEDENE